MASHPAGVSHPGKSPLFPGPWVPISKTSREVPHPFDILPTLRFCGSELTLLGESPEKQKLGRGEEREAEGSRAVSHKQRPPSTVREKSRDDNVTNQGEALLLSL